MRRIYLVTVLVFLQCLATCILADPGDNKPASTATSLSKPSKLGLPGYPNIPPLLLPEAKPQTDDEILDTADFVFRPLFVYRQQQAKRRRLKENRRKAIRRNDPPFYYPYGYPSYAYPYYRPLKSKPKKKQEKREHEFPSLF
ncbi:hypothetical protein Trydic_g6294 [Trypoxylus dichotomus]